MTEPHPAPTNLRSLTTRLNELARRLDTGWGGFTGTLEQLPPAEPEGVAEQ
jgi:hypothetical protein